MTVAELIEWLQEEPPDAEVMGYDDRAQTEYPYEGYCVRDGRVVL